MTESTATAGAPETKPLLSAVFILFGVALAGIAALADLRPSTVRAGFGLNQSIALNVGVAITLLGFDVRAGREEAWLASLRSSVTNDLGRLVGILVQLSLTIFVVRWFQIENPAFHTQVVPFVAAGFLLHHLMPAHRRLWFFVSLSLTAYVMVLGWLNAAWLIGVVVLFMGLCHVPVSWAGRLWLLGLATVGLGALRLHDEWTPFSRAIWPVLGSILMFRLIVYWYDVRHAKGPTPVKWSLAYFFVLPNVVFPLFPVIDFATMRRTYYDQDAFAIYQRGMEWVLRGLMHLILYRIVYQHLVIPPDEVITGVELVRYMCATFLMYLRVSGTFHLIVGMLHLFGFRLPETHRFFYLATSFTDFWRRINIYWKDFMLKLVFYPVYFPLRKRVGDTWALVLGTLAVFFITWLTHAYQWFWILGTGLLSAPDALFWGVLGVLLVVNSLWESKRGRKRVLPGSARRNWRDAALNGLRAAGVFTVICTLWTMWGSPTWGDFTDVMTVAPFRAVDWLAVLGVIGGIAVAGFVADLTGRSSGDTDTGKAPAPRSHRAMSLQTLGGLAVLAVLTLPGVVQPFGSRARELARDIRFPELNKADAQAMQRGYYENLQAVSTQNSQLWELYAERPTEGQDIWRSGVLHERADFLAREIRPGFRTYQRGHPFSTNVWGMRDRDYAREKPAGTYRIALLGQSYVAGDGVGDGETFEELVEDRLAARADTSTPTVEILNFAVATYSVAQQLLQLDDKVFAFDPDVVVRVAHPSDAERFAIHIIQQLQRGVRPPWPEVDSIVTIAGVTADLRETESLSRLGPYQAELLAWADAEIVRRAAAHGARAVWVYLDLPERAPDKEHVARMVAAARAAGFAVVDWSDVYDGYDLATLRSASWDFHPNASGHRVIADRFMSELNTNPAFGLPRATEENP